MLEERDPELEDQEDIIMSDSREDQCSNPDEDDEDMSNMHTLRWYVYME